MTKKLIDGCEYFDGQPVAIYEGRFAGAFPMVEETAAPIANDDQVTFLVTARVEAPKFSYVKKTGDLKRANSMRVEAAFYLDPHEAKYFLDNMGEKVEGINDGLVETVDKAVSPEPQAEPEVDDAQLTLFAPSPDWTVNA